MGNILIARMKEHADLSQEAAMPRGPERKAAVFKDLMATATSSQAGALAKLEELKASGVVTRVESMYLPNAIVITAANGKHQSVIDALAGVANVSGVTENHTWSVESQLSTLAPQPAASGAVGAAAGAALLQFALAGRAAERGGAGAGPVAPSAPAVGATPATNGTPVAAPGTAPPGGADGPTKFSGPTPEWGVAKIGAPEAWAKGIDGTGVTIGIVDTGLDSTHPAIAAHYRGTNADGSQSHDYNWFDPFQGKATPYDDGEHGTHVAGTTAGGTDARAIGVAPGAKIIAAKAILGSGSNTTEGTLRALQFMLAPTKTDGSSPDPTKGADVVNNSWGNADRNDETFMETFAGLKAAGIEVVTAAGNDGPNGKVSPPGSYPGYFSIAASTKNDTIASFSSRGPSKFAKPGDLVPNLAAPGQGVTSSVPGGGFANMSGTSMASPHMAGAVALMLQAKPQATHDELLAAFANTAVDIDAKGPDNAAGFGRIDVNKAIDYLKSHTPDDVTLPAVGAQAHAEPAATAAPASAPEQAAAPAEAPPETWLG